MGEVLQTDRPADGIINAYYRSHRFMGSTDRRAVGTLVWGVLRTRARLSWQVEHAGATVTPRALLIAWRLLCEGADRGELLFSFPDGKPGPYDPKSLSAGETRLIDALEKVNALDHPEMPDAVRYELPDWLYERMVREFGDRTFEELEALLREAPLDLRVNTLKTTRDDVLALLEERGITAEAGTHSPWAVRVSGRPNIAALPAFQEGLFEVQDEGSQMIALAAGVKPGQSVLDLCAGAGGKTLAMAQMMNNKGSVTATDVSEKRLSRARVRLQRAGVHNVTCRPLESETNRWLKRRQGSFDVVLVDAPCSGTGTFRRNPDARWRLWPRHIDRLRTEQTALLERAATLVKPGGRLVYATCSVLGEENEARVSEFLATRADYSLDPEAGTGAPLLRFSPSRDGTDGFFVAVLKRDG
nr:RsmB/NOP family class I SAM-dependent RNA methyltransferase [Phaeovibrio sulfidiphilus]